MSLIALLVLSSGNHWWLGELEEMANLPFRLNLWEDPRARIVSFVILGIIALGWFWTRMLLGAPREIPIETSLVAGFDDQEGDESKDLIKALVSEASAITENYGAATIALLADILAEPRTYVNRLTESVEVGRRVTTRSVQLFMFLDTTELVDVEMPPLAEGEQIATATTSEIRPDPSSPQSTRRKILVPLVQQEKGRMYERMNIESSTDRDAVSLSYGGGSLAAYVAALMHLFVTAFDIKDAYADWGDSEKAAFLSVAQTVATTAAAISAKARNNDTDRDTVIAALTTEIRNSLAERKDASEVGIERKIADQDQYYKLLRVASIGIAHYVIVVQCNLADYLNFHYTYQQPTDSLYCDPDPGDMFGLTRRMNRVIGKLARVPNGFLRLSLTGARHAKSYHMDISLQESGNYIQNAYYQIERKEGMELMPEHAGPVTVNPRPLLAVDNPYLRKPTKSGSTAHIYGRNLGRFSEGDLKDAVDRKNKRGDADG
ncbi:hypothetical protein [Nocardia sp. NPDC050435]|uniref:hypothetical protein n=1 Tax=Nocardia sp. NPDC050435 TaxID=3155040 RepID=UPI0033ED6060